MSANLWRAIPIAIQANVPTMLIGKPGSGKTKYMESLGRKMKAEAFTPAVLSTLDPQVIGGFEMPGEDGFTSVQLSGLFKPIMETQVFSMLFFDEFSTAPPACQAAGLRVTSERMFGHRHMPDGVRIIGAMNPPEEAANGWVLPAPAANRWYHHRWDVDAFTWVDGYLAGFPEPDVDVLPKNWESGIPAEAALIGAFIRTRPSLLIQLPEDEDKAGGPWPSPRTWEMSGKLLAAAKSVGAPEGVVNQLVLGTVGEAGMEFLNWRSEQDLPDPETLIKNPKSLKLPDRGDRQFAVLGSVVAFAIRHKDEKTKQAEPIYDAAWQILAIASDKGAKDVAVVSARNLAKNPPSGYTPPLSHVAPFTEVLKVAGIRGKKR